MHDLFLVHVFRFFGTEKKIFFPKSDFWGLCYIRAHISHLLSPLVLTVLAHFVFLYVVIYLARSFFSESGSVFGCPIWFLFLLFRSGRE